MPGENVGISSLAPDIEQSIDKLTAESVVSRLFYEIDRVAEPEVVNGEWLNQLVDVIKFSQDIETGFGHAKAYALAIIRKHWDRLPLDVRRSYDYQFMHFARLFTGREKSTILNYISTAELWFIEKTRPEGTIPVKVRDASGRPVINPVTDQVRTKSVDFNPYLVDISKLLLVNGTARRGGMTEQLWEMLVDSFYSCDDIRAALTSTGTLAQEEFYYFVEGPGLFVRCNGTVICLAEELNWADYEKDVRTREIMNKFFSMLGVNLDTEEDKLYAISHASRERHSP